MSDIDREIAEKVMGWSSGETEGSRPDIWLEGIAANGANIMMKDEWNPSADIAQAFQVVERMREDGYDYTITKNHDDAGYTEFWIQCTNGKTLNYGAAHFMDESEIPGAICEGALKAKEG